MAEIFKFCKKYMKLHVMDINICENEKIDQDPPIALRFQKALIRGGT